MKAKILLIEDNEQNRYLATFLLEQRGFSTVVPRADGPAGIELRASANASTSSCSTSSCPAWTATPWPAPCAPSPRLARVPIVAVTSYAMVGDREKALAAGCDGYLEKPIDPETFVAEVKRHLRPPAKETSHESNPDRGRQAGESLSPARPPARSRLRSGSRPATARRRSSRPARRRPTWSSPICSCR